MVGAGHAHTESLECGQCIVADTPETLDDVAQDNDNVFIDSGVLGQEVRKAHCFHELDFFLPAFSGQVVGFVGEPLLSR